MSKYSDYIESKPKLESVKKAIYPALRLDADGNYEHGNDKATFQFNGVSVEMGYGWYGCSSWYSTSSPIALSYILRAVNCFSRQIGEKAIALAEADLEEKRIAAKAEAEQVIAEVKV